jgi:hypothetical protein
MGATFRAMTLQTLPRKYGITPIEELRHCTKSFHQQSWNFRQAQRGPAPLLRNKRRPRHHAAHYPATTYRDAREDMPGKTALPPEPLSAVCPWPPARDLKTTFLLEKR